MKLSLLASLLCQTATDAYVVLSRHSTQVAFHSAVDSRGDQFLTTGVLFRTPFFEYTLSGASDSDCYIGLGGARGFGRAIYKSPQFCTRFEMYPPIESLPSGVSAGMDGTQGTLSTIDLVTSDFDVLPHITTVLLPIHQFPVDLATDAQGGVYVGMHDTTGLVPPPAALEPDRELSHIIQYYTQMTHPRESTQTISPILAKYDMVQSGNTNVAKWELELTTTNGRSTIGFILYASSRDLVVVVGSSNGQGTLVGAGAFSNSWDGYVTLVNATTGTADTSAGDQTHLIAEHSLRVQSQVNQDEYLLGACLQDDDLFILGTSTGKMTTEAEEGGGAFIMKLDIDTFQVHWTHQWSGAGSEAMFCSFTVDGLYVAGHVPPNILLEEDPQIRDWVSPTQDVFVALVDMADGTPRWTRQIDSREDDRLANILTTATGHLFLAFNAMDFDLGVSDIISMLVQRSDGYHDWQDIPQDSKILRGITTASFTPKNMSNEDDNRALVIAVSVVVPLLLLFLVSLCAWKHRKRRPTAEAGAMEEQPEEPAKAAPDTEESSTTVDNVKARPNSGGLV